MGITERAAAFIVATDDDAENVYAVLAARVLAPDVPVIARAASSEAVRRLEAAGALRVFSPPIEGALSIVGFVRRPHVSDVLDQLLNPHAHPPRGPGNARRARAHKHGIGFAFQRGGASGGNFREKCGRMTGGWRG